MEILIIAFLILINGVFAMSEMALVTSRKSSLKQKANSGDKKAKTALELAENPSNFLSTIQVGITLVAILSGAFAGEAIIDPLSVYLSQFQLIDKYSEAIALLIVVSLITFFSILFGELVPKRLALRYPEKITVLIAIPIKTLSLIFAPVVFTLTYATDTVLNLLKVNNKEIENLINREEIKIMLAEGLDQGTIAKEEVEMVYSVFKLNDITVKNVMNPLSKIISFDKNTSISKIINETKKAQHSRYPVYEVEKTNIIGFVHIKDIYLKIISEESKFGRIYQLFLRLKGDQKLKDLGLIRPINKVNQDMKIDDAMVILKNKAAHIALVKDKSDKTVGIISLEDLFENVVGEIKDEFDELNVKPK